MLIKGSEVLDVNGGFGDDVIDGSRLAAGTLRLVEHGDSLGGGNNTLIGSPGDDELFGGAGDDRLEGRGGAGWTSWTAVRAPNVIIP